MAPRPLPPELRRAAIRTSTAGDHDVSRKRLRHGDVAHPYHAVSAIGLDLTSVRDRAAAFLPVMESGQTFSHVTALALHGAPLPALPPELHVSVAFPRTPPRRPGVRGHSLASAPSMLLDSLPVSPPHIAWAEAAALLGREDLVAVGDYLANADPRVLALVDDLVATWQGRPGAARLAWAASRVRFGVRSRPETLLRLLLVRHHLPEPRVAPPIMVTEGLTLHPDLAYLEKRLALEYEGDIHRSRQAWARDIERRELFADAGWRTIRVTAEHLFGDPVSLVERVRRHLSD